MGVFFGYTNLDELVYGTHKTFVDPTELGKHNFACAHQGHGASRPHSIHWAGNARFASGSISLWCLEVAVGSIIPRGSTAAIIG